MDQLNIRDLVYTTCGTRCYVLLDDEMLLIGFVVLITTLFSFFVDSVPPPIPDDFPSSCGWRMMPIKALFSPSSAH